MIDLQIHNKLTQKVENLEKELKSVKAKLLVANRAKVRKDDQIIRGNKAKILLELKRDGYLDWPLIKIASDCFLSINTIRGYCTDIQKGNVK